VCLEGAEAQGGKEAEREALLLLQRQLSLYVPWATATWSDTLDHCQWGGVSCSDAGLVTQLYLDSSGLGGTIPSELTTFANLEVLYLHSNALQGTLPPELSQLSMLRELDLSSNQLDGPIPAELSALVKLQTLSLRQNRLTGELPAGIGELTALQSLTVSGNDLTGLVPPQLSTLGNLRKLYLHDNNLWGQVPRGLAQLTELRELDLHGNALSGYLPAQLSSLSKLSWLALGENRLAGPLPRELSRLTSLRRLLLQENLITGSLPRQWSTLMHLSELYLQGNRLTGTLPNEYAALTAVSQLDLAYNAMDTGDMADRFSEFGWLSPYIVAGFQGPGPPPPAPLSPPSVQVSCVDAAGTPNGNAHQDGPLCADAASDTGAPQVVIIGAACGGLVALLAAAIVIFLVCRRRRRSAASEEHPGAPPPIAKKLVDDSRDGTVEGKADDTHPPLPPACISKLGSKSAAVNDRALPQPVVHDSAQQVVRSAGRYGQVATLGRAVWNLHVGLDRSILAAPVRLVRIDAILQAWSHLLLYEDVPEADYLEAPYKEMGDELWSRVAVLSWRWSRPKARERTEGWSPMSEHQFVELKRTLGRAARHGLELVWIDWSCVPQYTGDPIVEIHRSRLYYARARLLVVLPDFRPLGASPVLRLVLTNAKRLVDADDAAGDAALEHSLVSEALARILDSDMIASREYFGRVWTLAERVARGVRTEQLCQWLSLDVWLGMVVDALIRGYEDESTGIYWLKLFPPEVLESLTSVERAVALAERAHHVTEELETAVAALCKDAMMVWRDRYLEEVPSPAWLRNYLQHDALRIYRAWDSLDAVWSVYGYFCWRAGIGRGPDPKAECLTALEDLCLVAEIDPASTPIYDFIKTGALPPSQSSSPLKAATPRGPNLRHARAAKIKQQQQQAVEQAPELSADDMVLMFGQPSRLAASSSNGPVLPIC